MRATFAIRDHWLEATLSNNGLRLLEVLNDSRTEYMSVGDAMLSRAGQKHGAPLAGDCLLQKSQIILAMPGGTHESPEKRRNAYREKRQRWATVTVPGYQLHGHLHLTSGGGNLVTTLTHEFGTFVPLSNVVLTPMYDGATQLHADTVILNKAWLALFCLEEECRSSGHEADRQATAPTAAPQPQLAEDPVDKLIRELRQMRGISSPDAMNPTR